LYCSQKRAIINSVEKIILFFARKKYFLSEGRIKLFSTQVKKIKWQLKKEKQQRKQRRKLRRERRGSQSLTTKQKPRL